MNFNPLRVFVPFTIFTGSIGILKMVYDFVALITRSPEKSWTILLEPALSTSAILLMFISVQLLMIGMVADGIIRRITLHKVLFCLPRGSRSSKRESLTSMSDQ